MAKTPNTTWFVYLLACQNGRLYTGITVDLGRRFAEHASGMGAMFTRLNRPARILAAQPCLSRSEASKLEALVKRLSPANKRKAAAHWPLQTADGEAVPCFMTTPCTKPGGAAMLKATLAEPEPNGTLPESG